MSVKSYYEKKWERREQEKEQLAYIGQWQGRELEMFYYAIKTFIGQSILDIGAGDGAILTYIQKQKNILELYGLEISESAIKQGKILNPSIVYIQGSADDKYPFADNKFDTLLMTDVIEHLLEVDSALVQCNRVLRLQGKLIIITPVFNWLKKIIIAAFFWEKFFHPTNQHIRFFTKKSMDVIMKKYGFKRVYYKWGLSWFGIMPQNAYFVYEKVS